MPGHLASWACSRQSQSLYRMIRAASDAWPRYSWVKVRAEIEGQKIVVSYDKGSAFVPCT
eukprot:1471265-Amphidinium_carterae.1